MNRIGSTSRLFSITGASLWCLLIALRCGNPVKPPPVTPAHRVPSLSVIADSTVLLHDTLSLHLSLLDTGTGGVRYAWFVDSPRRYDTTADSVIRMVFATADTGKHLIVVKAIDQGGTISAADSVHVRVLWFRPTVHIATRPRIGVNDTAVFMALDRDTNGTVTTWCWVIDSFRFMTTSNTVRWFFTDRAAGSHLVRVAVIDNNGFVSDTDSVPIVVAVDNPPLLAPQVSIATRATIGIDDTAVIVALSSDVNGSVKVWNWTIDSFHFMTSSNMVRWTFHDKSTAGHTVRVSFVDDSGAVSNTDSARIEVALVKPPLLTPRVGIATRGTIGINDTAVIMALDSSVNGSVKVWNWTIDSFHFMTASNTVRWFFKDRAAASHLVQVSFVDDSGAVSNIDSARIEVSLIKPILLTPKVALATKSVIGLSDTAIIVAQSSDVNGSVRTWNWEVDSFKFMTATNTVRWMFNDKAAAGHVVRASFVDDSGAVSNTDSARIEVTIQRPSVTLKVQDTTVYAYSKLVLHAAARDSLHSIAGFRWAIDGRAVPSVKVDSLTASWDSTGIGKHLVSVVAVNVDSTESFPDTTLVQVRRGGPVLIPIRDTTLPSLDTLEATAIAADPNGSVVKYLWNYSGRPGWDDSTASPSHRFAYAGTSSVTVIVAARDDNGLRAADTFKVRFNLPPDSVQVTAPGPNDSVIIPQSLGSYTASFAFRGFDPENDSLAATVLWGTRPDSLQPVSSGYATTAQVKGIAPGRYYWRVQLTDRWGRSCSKSGTLAVIRQYRICFVGHSYVTGYGGDEADGGFRGRLLDSIRKTLGPWAQLKPVGPMITQHMSRSTADDSCLAVDGAMGSELIQSLTLLATQLSADMWVLCTGVNDGAYNPTGLSTTIQILDILQSRNPDGRVYVLNAMPCPVATTYWIPSFNAGIDSVVTLRNAGGAHLFVVDAGSVMAAGLTPNTALYNSDGLHPTQQGYNLIADTILATMRRSVPPAIP